MSTLEVGNSCQIINIRKSMSFVWLKLCVIFRILQFHISHPTSLVYPPHLFPACRVGEKIKGHYNCNLSTFECDMKRRKQFEAVRAHFIKIRCQQQL
jgi:hypothetical protein